MYLGVGKRETVQQGSVVVEISWHTHNKYCYMLFNCQCLQCWSWYLHKEYAVREPGWHQCSNH